MWKNKGLLAATKPKRGRLLLATSLPHMQNRLEKWQLFQIFNPVLLNIKKGGLFSPPNHNAPA
jgi:hypothetical protein